MFRFLTAVTCVALTGCNTPGPHFRGAPAKRITVDGAVFDIRQRNDLAEAMRINPQWAPRLKGLEPAATKAMQLATGCDVTRLRGDQALLLGELDCDGQGARRRENPSPDYECVPVDEWLSPGLGTLTTAFDCSPIRPL